MFLHWKQMEVGSGLLSTLVMGMQCLYSRTGSQLLPDRESFEKNGEPPHPVMPPDCAFYKHLFLADAEREIQVPTGAAVPQQCCGLCEQVLDLDLALHPH
jgi:hypothetical protein